MICAASAQISPTSPRANLTSPNPQSRTTGTKTIRMHILWDDTKQVFFTLGDKPIHPSGRTSFGMTPREDFPYSGRRKQAFPTPPPQSKPSPSSFFLNHRSSGSVCLVYVTSAPRSVFCLNSCEKHRVCFTQRYITLD